MNGINCVWLCHVIYVLKSRYLSQYILVIIGEVYMKPAPRLLPGVFWVGRSVYLWLLVKSLWSLPLSCHPVCSGWEGLYTCDYWWSPYEACPSPATWCVLGRKVSILVIVGEVPYEACPSPVTQCVLGRKVGILVIIGEVTYEACPSTVTRCVLGRKVGILVIIGEVPCEACPSTVTWCVLSGKECSRESLRYAWFLWCHAWLHSAPDMLLTAVHPSHYTLSVTVPLLLGHGCLFNGHRILRLIPK